MEDERRRDVGLFRYSLVREAADPALSNAERGALVRALAGAEHVTGDGRRVRVGRSTLDQWIRAWRAGGFEALVPKPRAVSPRTPAEILELAESLKREAPGRTAAQVVAVMAEMAGAGKLAVAEVPSARTLQRHFARLGLTTCPDGTPPRAFGRFEASAPNELWTGDALHGPVVAGRKAYLLAFIDDFSRALVGHRWTAAEDTIRLEGALRAGLACRGVPKAILVDRGAAFVSAPLARACAVLGVRLIHASPRAAATKHQGQDREIFPNREGPIPRRARRPGRRRRSGRAQRAVQRLGRGRLSPPRPFGDEDDPAGTVLVGPARRGCRRPRRCTRRSCGPSAAG